MRGNFSRRHLISIKSYLIVIFGKHLHGFSSQITPVTPHWALYSCLQIQGHQVDINWPCWILHVHRTVQPWWWSEAQTPRPASRSAAILPGGPVGSLRYWLQPQVRLPSLRGHAPSQLQNWGSEKDMTVKDWCYWFLVLGSSSQLCEVLMHNWAFVTKSESCQMGLGLKLRQIPRFLDGAQLVLLTCLSEII